MQKKKAADAAKAAQESEAAAAEEALANYSTNYELAVYTMLSGAGDAETCGNLIKQVWYNAINKESDSNTNKYTRPDTERIVFPYATQGDLHMELIGKARQMAVNKNKNHPWKNMSDMELLKSAGLYERDRRNGQEGYNMACILLFGTKEAILSCVPGYKTDAIYRVENLDRYDDRLIVENNLIESYDLLMEFIAKHTNDKFFLIDNVNVSVRSAIAREVVSNILVHREFGNPFPAKLIITEDKIYTENWNRAQRVGKIELQDFTPYPKNPLLANFFVNIGYADSLGSGVRNLYKYTKIYSGGESDLEEGDVFKITVPIHNERVERKTLVYNEQDVSKKISSELPEEEQSVVNILKKDPSCTTTYLAETLKVSRMTISKRLKSLKNKGILKRVGSDRKGYWKINL